MCACVRLYCTYVGTQQQRRLGPDETSSVLYGACLMMLAAWLLTTCLFECVGLSFLLIEALASCEFGLLSLVRIGE